MKTIGIYFLQVSVGQEFRTGVTGLWSSLKLQSRCQLGPPSPDSLIGAGGSPPWWHTHWLAVRCWLLAGGLGSLPHRLLHRDAGASSQCGSWLPPDECKRARLKPLMTWPWDARVILSTPSYWSHRAVLFIVRRAEGGRNHLETILQANCHGKHLSSTRTDNLPHSHSWFLTI